MNSLNLQLGTDSWSHDFNSRSPEQGPPSDDSECAELAAGRLSARGSAGLSNIVFGETERDEKELLDALWHDLSWQTDEVENFTVPSTMLCGSTATAIPPAAALPEPPKSAPRPQTTQLVCKPCKPDEAVKPVQPPSRAQKRKIAETGDLEGHGVMGKASWRKYGQKTLKGKDSAEGAVRCYYRCTRPGCQVSLRSRSPDELGVRSKSK